MGTDNSPGDGVQRDMVDGSSFSALISGPKRAMPASVVHCVQKLPGAGLLPRASRAFAHTVVEELAGIGQEVAGIRRPDGDDPRDVPGLAPPRGGRVPGEQAAHGMQATMMTLPLPPASLEARGPGHAADVLHHSPFAWSSTHWVLVVV